MKKLSQIKEIMKSGNKEEKLNKIEAILESVEEDLPKKENEGSIEKI